ncbi:MAG: TIGR02186 family protein [Deltaproteobacteria bacterium]|nr:TIGR02186 family protein [Deltaproteobacteria bacterium]
MYKLSVALLCAVTLALFGASLAECGQPARVTLEPNVIIIGATYHGATLTVTGTIPEGTEAVVNVVGQRKDTAFKKKGKAIGLLWMNLGTVVFHNVPNLYLVYAGNLSNDNDLPVGFNAIKNEIAITPDSENKDFLFNEFIKLKTKEGLYSVNKGAVQYGKTSNGIRPFLCKVALPSRLVPGTYEVSLIAIRNGKIVANTTQVLKVKEEGLPNLVASLAFRHSTTYGILATVIAIIAGLIMGLVFKGGKGGH